mgnify:CR=1 FL=1
MLSLIKMSKFSTFLLLLIIILSACQDDHFTDTCIITPQGDSVFLHDTTPPPHALSFKEIKESGNIRLLAYIGEHTYYNYYGQEFGTQYLIMKEFAKAKGLTVLVDSCKDSTEVIARLHRFEGDVAAMEKAGDFRAASKELQDSINSWYNDTIISYVKNIEKAWLGKGGIIRHEYPMYIDLKKGLYSQYDSLFQIYAKSCDWDWRLLAAQCYQESTFDKDAISFAGARGLMQIMPKTAEMLELPFAEMFTPNMNIKAAAKLINILEEELSFIPQRYERQNFILAAYNGGLAHVLDAIALAKADSVTTLRWDSIAPYILLLAEPEGYQHPAVEHGYMRGTETVGYVRNIRKIYAIYGGNNFLQKEPYKIATLKENDESTSSEPDIKGDSIK